MIFPDGKRKGEDIVTCLPYVHVLSGSERGRRCEECFSSPMRLLRCAACSTVRYCNAQCQKQAWKIHKEECKCFQRVAPRVPSESVRLMYRLLLRLQWGHDESVHDKVGNRTRSFQNFVSHVEDIKKDENRMSQFVQLFKTVQEFVGDFLQLPTPEICLQTFGKMTVNSFSVCDPEMRPIGVGVYLGPSLFNHSCQPNAVTVFSGTELHVRALKDIPPGQEVHISYIDQLATSCERKKQLQEQYYFTCQCPLCNDSCRDELMSSSVCLTKSCNQPILQSQDGSFKPCEKCGEANFDSMYSAQKQRQTAQAKVVLDMIKQMRKNRGTDYSVVLSECRKCLGQMQGILHSLNAHHIQVMDAAMDACIELNQWHLAVDYATKTIEPYKQLYPAPHPNVGIQLMKMGKILLYLGKLHEALKYLHQAEDILQVTHGEKHSLWRQLVVLREQCEGDMREGGS